jgi:DNA-binding Xre family transcriptional regulator
MSTPDKKILRLIEVLIFQKKIIYKNDFCKEIGILRQTVSRIKKGTNHFTVQHIEIICSKYDVNANWIFGKDRKVFNTPDSIEIDI